MALIYLVSFLPCPTCADPRRRRPSGSIAPHLRLLPAGCAPPICSDAPRASFAWSLLLSAPLNPLCLRPAQMPCRPWSPMPRDHAGCALVSPLCHDSHSQHIYGLLLGPHRPSSTFFYSLPRSSPFQLRPAPSIAPSAPLRCPRPSKRRRAHTPTNEPLTKKRRVSCIENHVLAPTAPVGSGALE